MSIMLRKRIVCLCFILPGEQGVDVGFDGAVFLQGDDDGDGCLRCEPSLTALDAHKVAQLCRKIAQTAML